MRLGVVIGFFYILIMLMFKCELVSLFSEEKGVLKFVSETYLFMIAAFLGSWVLTLINAVTKGLG
jgi:Na+-driven multidrug efflux pump